MHLHTTLCLLLLLLVDSISSANGLTCHCNVHDGSADSCAQGTNQCSVGAYACVIEAIQAGSVIRQRCSTVDLDQYICDPQRFDPKLSNEGLACCITDNCNTEEFLRMFLPTAPPPVPTDPGSSGDDDPELPTNTSSSISQPPTSTPVAPLFTTLPSSTTVQLTVPTTPSASPVYSPSATTTSTEGTTVESTPVESTPPITGNFALPDYTIPVIAVLVTVLLLLAFGVGMVVVIIIRFNPRHIVGMTLGESDTHTMSTGSEEFSNDRMQQLVEGTTSGSGSGLPILEQRSVATQVTLHEKIGKGRFGEVWKGEYKGDWIAVKLFHTVEEASWFHEVDIYNTCLLRHPNVLRFIAADNKDVGIATQLWLITEYCEMGSLYEVLLNRTFDEDTMLKLCLTAASGLAHLHSQMTATDGKPPIAHRDIKSRNILVKGDFSCCIADLGLALRYNRATDTIEELPSKRVGTRRYLSPEVLNESLNAKNFDSFKRADMYSFGLVMWEIARRGECKGHAEEYQLPYFDCVSSDPSFDDMKRVVAVDGRRPCLSNHWSQSEVFQGLSRIITQCWLQSTEARLTALRVKKSLTNLRCTQTKQKHIQ